MRNAAFNTYLGKVISSDETQPGGALKVVIPGVLGNVPLDVEELNDSYDGTTWAPPPPGRFVWVRANSDFSQIYFSDNPYFQTLGVATLTATTVNATTVDTTAVESETLVLTGTSEVDLSTSGALLIGPTATTNLTADRNELQVRNGASAASMYLQPHGSNVYMGLYPVWVSDTGYVNALRLELDSTTDASLSSTAHAFQIGDRLSANLIMDTNEIQARNNVDTAANLFINAGGGDVVFQGGQFDIEYSTGEVKDTAGRQFVRADDGRTSAQMVSFAEFSGTTDSNGDLVVTFPEAFTTAPIVVACRSATSTNERTCHVRAVTTTTFTIRCFGGGTLQTTTSVVGNYVALGPNTSVT